MMAEGGISARQSRPSPRELRLDKPVLRRPLQGEPAVSRLDEPERVPLQFHLDHGTVPPETAEVMDHIKQLAEKLLYSWKSFPINLPAPLTNLGDEEVIINYRDLFQAPTFDELEQVASDGFGDLKKLSAQQLQSIWDSGEFDVPSINFPGQVHRWRLSQLFQKGSKKARNSLLNDSALALRVLIITARNRIYSKFFSLSESVKSWGRGLWKILDILLGMPATSPQEIESKIHWEHTRYLVAELDVKSNSREGFKTFCEYVKARSRLSTAEKNKTVLRPPPIPYIYQTPKGQDIDLRLFNKDLINHCLQILSLILEREAKGWYVSFRQKLLRDLKGEGLSTEELTKRVNSAVKEEYLKRVFSAILKNVELENLEPGIGALLVAQAKSALAMQKATDTIEQKMQKHKADLLAHLKKAYPVKSRINDWVNAQLQTFEKEFVLRNLWSAHEEAIRLCEEEELHQSVYFLRRDLNFIKEREDILLSELSKVRRPNRVYTFSMRIWLPSNWVTVKVVDGEDSVVPTVIATEKKRHSGSGPALVSYHVKKYNQRKTSTQYPLWRWWNYLHRSWAWMWNSVFFFGIVVPWCSPLSLRALFNVTAFQPDLAIDQRDGKLYPDESTTIQTLLSRLAALWANIRKSREQFEATPDRGFLGKSLTRHFNRLWNYFVKGAVGSFLLVTCFPVMCTVVSTLSLVLAVTAPVWAPVITLIAHIFALLVFDFDRPGDEVNRWSILLEAVVWRWLIQGTIQPVLAVIVGFIGCPLVSLGIMIFGLTRRAGRGLWDTFMYQAVIKSRARVPSHDSFVARRIAGPGLASNYFLQIRPEQALAALEASMELDELTVWKANVMTIIEKPVEAYKSSGNSNPNLASVTSNFRLGLHQFDGTAAQSWRFLPNMILFKDIDKDIDIPEGTGVGSLWWKKPEYPEETTDLGWVTITLPHANTRNQAQATTVRYRQAQVLALCGGRNQSTQRKPPTLDGLPLPYHMPTPGIKPRLPRSGIDRHFVDQVFKPFSAGLIGEGVYKQLLVQTSNFQTDVTKKVHQRELRLNTGLSYDVQSKIKLPEKQLKMTILQAAKMMEFFYPNHVISQQSLPEEDYWERKQLESRDWTGLASQKLSDIFSPSFLEPLEDTDNHFELKVHHVNLSRYMKMLETAEFHDDLDLVTEVHNPTGDISTRPPHLRSEYFNPSQQIIQTHRYYSTRKRRFPWSRAMFQAEFDKLEVPLPIPHPAIIAISVYNREHERHDLNFNDIFCRTLIKAIKSKGYKNIADPNAPDSNDQDNSTPDNEVSTPDNGVEPVSIVSHLAEQEHSFSDDTAMTVSPSPSWQSPTPQYERRVQMYMDDAEEDRESLYDNNELETSSVVVDIIKSADETSV